MDSIPETVRNNPNASTAGGLTGVGVFVVWILGREGVSLSGEDATMISGGITSVGLFIGRSGICGLARLLWRGGGT